MDGRTFFLVFLARLVLIPFALLGTVLSGRIAARCFGQGAGALAATLWATSPSVLTFGASLTSDVPAAVSGLCVVLTLEQCLNETRLSHTLLLGVAIGFALSCKSLWLILFPLVPCLWFLGKVRQSKGHRREFGHCMGSLGIALLILNLGYGFDGTFQRLGDFKFGSRALSWITDNTNEMSQTENGTHLLRSIPIPLPRQFILGVDEQKRIFELGSPSYLLGSWRRSGSWYFYLLGLVVKEPIFVWLLVFLGLCAAYQRSATPPVRLEKLLLAVSVSVMLLVSSQTGFSHHFRYAIPVLPGVFLLASRSQLNRNNRFRQVAWLFCGAYVVCSGVVLPRSHSFTSIPFGGQYQGYRVLGGSTYDWGQGLLELGDWVRLHPERQPLYVLYSVPEVHPADVGIEAIPLHSKHQSLGITSNVVVPRQPGWYAVFADVRIRERGAWFRNRRETDRICPTIWVYFVDSVNSTDTQQRSGSPDR